MTAPNTPTVRVEWADSSRQSAFEAWLQPLAVLGRWSLVYYMLHQPVLLGALWMLGAATGHSMN